MKENTIENNDVLSNPKIKQFIEDVKFEDEDLHYLKELSTIRAGVLIQLFHNTFVFSKERCLESMNGIIEHTDFGDWRTEHAKEAAKIYRDLIGKYAWEYIYNLNRIFEDINPE